MTPRERLALVGADERDGMGDESARPDLTLEEKLHASIIDAITTRVMRVEAAHRETARQTEQHRHVLNRILNRFLLEGRPLDVKLEDPHAA